MKALHAAVLALVVACVAAGSLKYESVQEPEIELPGLFMPNVNAMLEEDANPKPCCLPTQWQGNITTQSGWILRRGRGDEEEEDRKGRRGGFQTYSATVYVDEDKKRVAGRVKCRNDTCGFISTMIDAQTADTYLFAIGAKKCLHNKTRGEFRKQCLPDNSTFQGSANLGPATGGLGVQLWSFHGKATSRNVKPEVYVGGHAVVTPDKCIPVVVQEYGMFQLRPGQEVEEDKHHLGGGRFMGSTYFNNVEASIKDPSVFTPPTYCKSEVNGGDLKLGEDMEFPDVIDRFIVLQ